MGSHILIRFVRLTVSVVSQCAGVGGSFDGYQGVTKTQSLIELGHKVRLKSILVVSRPGEKPSTMLKNEPTTGASNDATLPAMR